MLNGLAVALSPDERLISRANQSWARQGFVVGVRQRFGCATVWGFVRGENTREQGSPNPWSVQTAVGFACCVGPIWYRGRFGHEALELLLDDTNCAAGDSLASLDRSTLRGNYAIFMSTQVGSWLLNDPLGLQHLYRAADNRYFATSWLAARAYTGDGALDEAAAIEYVLQGASHSERTVARSVFRTPVGHHVNLSAKAKSPTGTLTPSPPLVNRSEAQSSLAAAVDAARDQLQAVFGDIVAAFSGRINAALSAGFDSRLVLSALLSLRERPSLFVYGPSSSTDVVVAREIARSGGLDLNEVDKDALDRTLEPLDREGLVQSALFFDGLPNDGIDDTGSDRQTRLDQTAGGCIAINGGGGEIFRNFFHLPDRSYTALDIVRVFYRGFDVSAFRRPTGLADYEAAMAASIVRALQYAGCHEEFRTDNGGRTVLSRRGVELVYPLFRCHYWMGLNNTAVLRHGYFCTPLVDLQMVNVAASLPLAWKNAGLFESRLIAALHTATAGHRSAYGFRMTDGPGRRARLNEMLTCFRPAWARPAINAIHRALDRGQGAAARVIDRYRQLLPGAWILDPVLDFSRLHALPMLSRLLAVEVVSRELPP